MKELKSLLAQIQARSYTRAELLGIKRDIEYRLMMGLGKQKAKLAKEIWGMVRGY